MCQQFIGSQPQEKKKKKKEKGTKRTNPDTEDSKETEAKRSTLAGMTVDTLTPTLMHP
jgi:hypothetical protein